MCSAVLSYSPARAQEYRQLAGTWKMEGKEIYEEWNLENGELTGYGYRLQNGERVVTEELRILTNGDRIIYQATVRNQNEGKPVEFVLNESYDDRLQFENPAHDFPRKIIYRIESPERIHVSVLGENDKGFQYYLEKVN